ncbi:hypothetical protein BP5796_05543 [Coleophoma crateriformis]|uniref:Uncharacterized protein n=1 Tax=Coleophoma crateriformis TaxID=565419 RepID=A0A3D8S3J3_9HELO|nr:hypothetical protein BP5796_05543 [Coleophoma crateriformis]
MAMRYTPEELKHLRQSPLVAKPTGLPPAEQWMGLPTDNARTQSNRQSGDRSKNHNAPNLPAQENRRPAHVSRNSTSNISQITCVSNVLTCADPEDIVLGPPKTSFMSATSIRNAGKPFDSPDRPGLRTIDSRDRYSFRDKVGDSDHERSRDARPNSLRPKRTDGESDGEGWSTVKPRKSFGTEGAERFNGRMGVTGHRDDKKEDRKFKDREDRDVKERHSRGFENFTRDKERERDHDHPDGEGRRNGNGRGRNEPSWFKEDAPSTPRDRNSNGDRFTDRNRGWREKDDRAPDRGDRTDRRWDRDQRQERDPEWMDELANEKNQAHTQEDFQKWKEQMAGKDGAKVQPTEETRQIPDAFAPGSFFGVEKAKVETPLPIDTGPDKFFGMWATSKDSPENEAVVESKKEGLVKSKTSGKASRFASLFTPQEEPQRRATEPTPPMPAAPQNALESLLTSNTQTTSEKEAFQQLLQKLQRQTLAASGSTPPINPAQQPKPPPQESKPQSAPMPVPEPFQQYRPERQDEGRQRDRNSQQALLTDLLSQRQMTGSQPSAVRPEQMLSELVSQRQTTLSQSSVRPDHPQSRNSNTEFLMGLMQSAKAAPQPQRTEELMLRMPPQKQQIDRQIQHQLMMEQREQEIQRERNAAQRQNQGRPGPQFFDERGGPPMQILQRPPPPGLEQMPPSWAQQPNQLSASQQRHVAPPPGLAGPGRGGMPMPQQMFPPGLPMGSFPPDVPNMRAPPGYYGPPPPGFPPQMSGFPGPDMAFGAGNFDGRGGPPPGFRRQ